MMLELVTNHLKWFLDFQKALRDRRFMSVSQQLWVYVTLEIKRLSSVICFFAVTQKLFGPSLLGDIYTLNDYWLAPSFIYSTHLYWVGFPGASDGKEPACNAGDPCLITGSGRSSGEGNSYPRQYFLPGEFHRQRNLEGYSPWGCKGSNTTKQLTHFFTEYL